jgi:hypothetical protein
MCILKNIPKYVLLKWRLIPVELFHVIVTTYLHYNMHMFTNFALIVNTLDFAVH